MGKIIAIAGPTAVGKTKFAIEIAKRFDGEIISCDSMQLYKYMDIGSAKPTKEELAQVPHHLVDLIDPIDDFSVAQYQKLAKDAIRDVQSRGKLAVISGGTGLYLNSLLYEMDFSKAPESSQYRRLLEQRAETEGGAALHKMLEEQDPQAAERIHPNNIKKIIRALERLHEGEENVKSFQQVQQETTDYETILIGLTRDRAELYDRINRRVEVLIEQGLLEEVEELMRMGMTEDHISMKAIGYKEILAYFHGRCSLETAIDNVKKNTRHYAKKQLTWFRRYDKIKWYNISEYSNDETAVEGITGWLEKNL